MTISVIIPCYNQGHYLGEAIESVLAQRRQDIEIIVVNDGSIDHSSQVARSYSGVVCIEQTNQGLSSARNRGFAASSGDYIIFLDSDDRLPEAAIECGLKALDEHPDAAFAYGLLRRIDANGRVENIRKEPESRDDCYRDLLKRNYIPTPGMVMFRRSTLEKHGLFNPDLSESADYDMYLRIARCEKITSHQNIAVDRRMHEHNMSGDAARMLRVTLMVHRAQWRYARREPQLRQAYKEGGQNWRRFYGDQLIDQFLKSFAAHRWRLVLSQGWLLLRQCHNRVWLRLIGE